MQHINISVSNDEKNFYGKDEYGNNLEHYMSNLKKKDYPIRIGFWIIVIYMGYQLRRKFR